MTFCYWKLRHEQKACMRVVFLSTTSSNLVIHVSSAEFLHLVYFPYTFSKTSAIHRTRTLIEAWCCCCWQICTSLTLSPLPLLTQNFSRIWKDHPEVKKDTHRNNYVIGRRSLKRKTYSASIWVMEGTNAEALLLDKTLSPSAKNKALLSLKKDELKQCVSKRNLVSTGTKQDLVSFLYF